MSNNASHHQATDDDLKSQLELIIQFVEEIEPEEDVLKTSQTSDTPRLSEGKEARLSQEARARLVPPMRLQQGVEIRDLGCRLETVSNATLEPPKCGLFPKRILSDGLEGPARLNGVDVRQAAAKIDDEKLRKGGRDPTTKTRLRVSEESVCSLSLADPVDQASSVQPTPSPRLKRKQKAPQPPLAPAASGPLAVSCLTERTPNEGSGISGFDNLISDLCVYSSNIETEVASTQKNEEDRRSQVGTITQRFFYKTSFFQAATELLQEKEEEINRLKSLAEDWKSKYLLVKDEAQVQSGAIKEKEKTIEDLEQKCQDLSTSLVNQVRNSEAEKVRSQKMMVDEKESFLDMEEKLRERGLEMELLQEERRKREKEWANILGQVEGRGKDLEEEVAELKDEVARLEEERVALRNKSIVAEKQHKAELETLQSDFEGGRSNLTKRVHQLEAQVGEEKDTWARICREKRGLEEQICKLEEIHANEVNKIRTELKRKTVLLRDAQAVLDRLQNEGGNRQVVKQLKAQLDDAEHARTAALRAKRHCELEVEDTQQQLEEVSKSRSKLEEKFSLVIRENAELASRLQDGEEETAEVMRKYRASVAAMGTDQITLQDQAAQIQELELERGKLKERVGELEGRLEQAEEGNQGVEQGRRAELKLTEMGQRLELEVTNRQRLEGQVTRLKEARDKMEKVFPTFQLSL